MAVSDWSTTADSNTSVGGVSIAEHCASRNLNDGMRAIMAEAKARFDSDSFAGEIRLFYGTLDTNGCPIPIDLAAAGATTGLTNWHVCDGTSGTPDMRGRVAVGVATGETLGATSGSDTVTPSITCDSATQAVSIGNTTLSNDQLSAHGHGFTLGGDALCISTISSSMYSGFQSVDPGYWSNHNKATSSIAITGTSASHTHSVTSSAHTHTLSVSSFNNRQSSRALHYIMRVS